jgi:hypothetical protein
LHLLLKILAFYAFGGLEIWSYLALAFASPGCTGVDSEQENINATHSFRMIHDVNSHLLFVTLQVYQLISTLVVYLNASSSIPG